MRLGRLLILLLAARAADGAESEIVIAELEAFRNLVNSECSPSTFEAERRASELRDDDLALYWIRGYFDGGAISIQALYRWDNGSIRGDR